MTDEDEIRALEDPPLLQRAWTELEAWVAPADIKSTVEAEFREIERELDHDAVLSRESRAILRSFLITKGHADS
jgi:hypothetical protein